MTFIPIIKSAFVYQQPLNQDNIRTHTYIYHDDFNAHKLQFNSMSILKFAGNHCCWRLIIENAKCIASISRQSLSGLITYDK